MIESKYMNETFQESLKKVSYVNKKVKKIRQTLQIYFAERDLERYFQAKYSLAGRKILLMIIYFPFTNKIIRYPHSLSPGNSQNEYFSTKAVFQVW